ncbi:unnamed protein product [Arabidopsis thaliana]|uniref:(thale cress) hypothetical protein n=1 Tax=Arabidopsis thaliana TaxID=3702 RepID=A0A7G2EUI0_ARATH|nr:unnamed protein product [Arabidopsis thaliana]
MSWMREALSGLLRHQAYQYSDPRSMTPIGFSTPPPGYQPQVSVTPPGFQPQASTTPNASTKQLRAERIVPYAQVQATEGLLPKPAPPPRLEPPLPHSSTTQSCSNFVIHSTTKTRLPEHFQGK